MKLFSFLILFVIQGVLLAEKPIVVASASMIADMVATIGGDKIEVQCVVPIGGDPHTYDPTPGDVEKIRRAKVVFVNGLTFEGWMNELIRNSGTQAIVDTVTKHVAPLQSPHYHNASDPHAWMSPQNGIFYIQAIYESLITYFPEYSDFFKKRYVEYKKELEDLNFYTLQKINKVPENQRILVTSHDAFQYFGRDYGFRLESVLGTSTDADVQVSDVIHLHQVLKKTGVKAVFVESTINPKVLKQIALDNGVVIGGSLFADSLGDENSPAPTYLKMLRYNIDTITDALSSGEVQESEKKETIPFLFFCIGLFALAWIFYIKLIS